MKKILLILSLFITGVSFGQWTRPNNSYGTKVNGISVDSASLIPTFCGVPKLRSFDKKEKKGAVAFDSCNNRFYTYNPKDSSWSYLGSGSGGRVDSVRIKSVPYIDSVFEYVSGTRVYIGKIYKKDGLQSGGEVRRITTNDYEITAAYYTIEGLDYSAVADTLTLNAYSDSAQFAAIYANAASIFQVRYGDKSSSPIPPVVNKSEEVLISLVLLMDTGRVIYGSEIDTTFLSDRINLKVDSVTRLVDGCQSILKYWIRGNAVVIDTFYKPNGIISGGNFTRINDTTFRIDTTRYSIGCVVRTVNQQNVILNGNNQNSTGRIDVIGVDNTGNPFVQQGINSVAPSIPQINTATQIGLLTVTFPALSDSGITNIYNTTVYNGLDSSAYRTIVQVDSFTIALCNLRGLCDTITRIYEAPKYVDSLRRSSDSVYARINNEWRFQYKDSVGTGGIGTAGTLDQTLRLGNTTRQEYNIIDSSAVAGTSLITWRLEPSNMRTNYDTRGTAMGFRNAYARYNGVNASGRPNVVYDWFSYNGAFNSPDSTNEASFRMGFETHFETGGSNLFENHLGGEFKPRGSLLSLRPMTFYMNKQTGYITTDMQVERLQKFMGGLTAIGDTVNFSVTPTEGVFGFRGSGTLLIRNQDSSANYLSIQKSLNGAIFSVNTPSTAAASVSYMSFASPITVSTSTTYGTSNGAAVMSTVGNANAYGFKVNQSGLSTSGFGGLSADVNTSGTYSHTYVRQLNATGTAQHWINVGSGATGQFAISDNANGVLWRMYLKSGDADRQLKIGFGTSTYDSLMKFRGTDGKTSIRTSLNVGSAAYSQASAALEVTSTTQGFLPPRMTATQASAISSPAEGLMVYVTDTNGTFTSKGWWGYDGSAWQKLNN